MAKMKNTRNEVEWYFVMHARRFLRNLLWLSSEISSLLRLQEAANRKFVLRDPEGVKQDNLQGWQPRVASINWKIEARQPEEVELNT